MNHAEQARRKAIPNGDATGRSSQCLSVAAANSSLTSPPAAQHASLPCAAGFGPVAELGGLGLDDDVGGQEATAMLGSGALRSDALTNGTGGGGKAEGSVGGDDASVVDDDVPSEVR